MPPGSAPGSAGRLGVEEEAIRRGRRSASTAARSAASAMPTAFMTGRPVRARIGGDALGRLRAVQLQQVRIEGRHDGVELGVVRIDEERRPQRPPLRLRRQARGPSSRSRVPRAFREAHEADEVRARVERGREGLGRARGRRS